MSALIDSRSEAELKKEFARLTLSADNHADNFQAALRLFPTNTNRALRVANEWPICNEVLEARAALIGELGEEATLPSKVTFTRTLYDRMSKCYTTDEFVKVAKLIADVQGFIEPPKTTINNNNTVAVNRVMIVRENGSDQDWEQKLRKQQEVLVSDGE